MFKLMLSAICVLATAAPLLAETAPAALTDIGGRWQGKSYADKGAGELTLDIVPCGSGWCGVKIEANEACGDTALKLDGGGTEGQSIIFKGTLSLAKGTEPYTIQSYLFRSDEGAMTLQVLGDTGGTFRIFRRSFPFDAQLTRTRDAICKAPQTVSMLDERAD